MSNVHAAIAARFCAPEWAVFFEVSNAAGFDRSRSADAIAMNLWPSRGLEVHGVEIKASRADWLRELRDPAKSESIQKFCDRWWLAVADDKVVQDGELPATWGLLVLRGKKLVQVREAPKLDAVPLTRNFIAAMLKRASSESVPKAAVGALVEEKLEARVRQQRDHRDREFGHLQVELDALRDRVKAFETASGIAIGDRWHFRSPEKVGAALSALINGKAVGKLNTLEQAQNVAKAFIRESEELINALRGLDVDAREAAE